MSFTPEQVKDLRADLSSAHVKKRTQGGRAVSYIEGWHAIAEANRIFGFDGWTRETVECKCVNERERAIGSLGKPGWGVSYIAKVRVTVGNIVREGYGAGHGIDQDLGQAHESAIKEAETDAMKRALMTLGNPFGLALYDKTQANVSDDPGHAKPEAMTFDSVVSNAKVMLRAAAEKGREELEAAWRPLTHSVRDAVRPYVTNELAEIAKQADQKKRAA